MKRPLWKSKRERKRMLFYSLMIALPLVQIFLFYFCVNFNSILLAFRNYNSETGWSFVGFENFSKVTYEMFHDSGWTFAFRNTFLAFFAVTISNLVLSLIFSYYIFKKGIGAKFFRVMLYLPSILSSIVMVILFEYFVNVFIPSLYEIFTGNQVDGLLSNPDTTMFMLIFYSVLTSFGTNVLLLSGAMQSVPTSVIEAARIDGANAVQQFFKVIFPQIFPTFVTILIVGLSGFFTNQLNLYSFYGGNAPAKLSTVGYLLFNRTKKASTAEYPELAAIGVLLTVIIVPVTLIIRRVLHKVGPSNE